MTFVLYGYWSSHGVCKWWNCNQRKVLICGHDLDVCWEFPPLPTQVGARSTILITYTSGIHLRSVGGPSSFLLQPYFQFLYLFHHDTLQNPLFCVSVVCLHILSLQSTVVLVTRVIFAHWSKHPCFILRKHNFLSFYIQSSRYHPVLFSFVIKYIAQIYRTSTPTSDIFLKCAFVSVTAYTKRLYLVHS